METLRAKIDWLQANLDQLDGRDQSKLARIIDTAAARMERQDILARCNLAENHMLGRGGHRIAKLRQMKKPRMSADLSAWQAYESATMAAIERIKEDITAGQELGLNLATLSDEEALARLEHCSGDWIHRLNQAYPLYRQHRLVKLSAKMGRKARLNWLGLLRESTAARAAA